MAGTAFDQLCSRGSVPPADAGLRTAKAAAGGITRVSNGRVVRRQSVQLVAHFMRRCCFSWARVYSAANFVLGLVALFSACILFLIDSVNNRADMVVGVVVAGMLLPAASACGCLLARRRTPVAVCHNLRHFCMRFALAACCMHETLSSR